MSNSGIIIFALCVFGFIYFIRYITLITKINEDGIKMYFVPFVKKSIKWSELESVKIVNYGFVGYGVRLGSKYGTVYNINGNKNLSYRKIDVIKRLKKMNEMNEYESLTFKKKSGLATNKEINLNEENDLTVTH